MDKSLRPPFKNAVLTVCVQKNEMKSFVAFLIFSLTTKCTADSIQQPRI